MLAPVIRLALILELAPSLLPVTDSRELGLRGPSAIPEVQEDGLARLGPQTGQRWYQAIGITNVLAVGDEIVVLIDCSARDPVPFGEGDFVVYRVSPEVDEAPDPEFLFRS